MMNNIHDRYPNNPSRSDQNLVTPLQLLVQKYLQSPFSISWSKLADLLQTDRNELEQYERRELGLMQKPELPPHFINRVRPPVYYSVFFLPKW